MESPAPQQFCTPPSPFLTLTEQVFLLISKNHPIRHMYRVTDVKSRKPCSKRRVSDSEEEVSEEREKAVKSNIVKFVRAIKSYRQCFMENSRKFTECSCLHELPDGYVDSVSDFLFKMGSKKKSIREPLICEWLMQSIATRQRRKAGCGKTKYPFLLPLDSGDEVNLCRQSFANLLGLKRTQWAALYKKAKRGETGPRVHGLTGKPPNLTNTPLSLCKSDLMSYFEALVETHGEPNARRFVQETTGVGIRNDEVRIVELPSSFSKRSLYERFCYERGWKIHATAKGEYPKLSEYPHREYDGVLWKEGDRKPVCSWTSFCDVWHKSFSHLKIRPRHEEGMEMKAPEETKTREEMKMSDKMKTSEEIHSTEDTIGVAEKVSTHENLGSPSNRACGCRKKDERNG